MAEPNMNQRGLVSLPRNWRVITVASLTTLGLAYGAGQPVQGEWWSLTKAKSEATKVPVTKPATTENGFSSTIHRLMSDARLYADKGDLDKAVQLAERAAKISEASSQLLGPASDCSPEQTAQFATDLRARRDAVAKRTVPAQVVPTIAAAAPKPQPTTPRSREIPSESPPLQPHEALVVERAVAERTATEQSTEIVAESRASKLAWAEELPPTPAPEPEPLNKPIKFRRSVLVRAGHSIDEEAGNSRANTEETTSPSSADSVIAEMLDAEFTDGLPIESPPTVPDAATTHAGTSLNETISSSPSTEAHLPSLNGEIQPVAAEAPTNEPPPLPAALGSKAGWENEAFAEELLLGKSSSAKSDGSSTEPASAATKAGAPPFPDDNFPVQRVVQLRRRLETAASLNPGGAYTMPASTSPTSPSTEPARAVSPSPSSQSKPPEPPHHVSFETSGRTDDWMTSTDSPEHPEKQTAIKSKPKERQVVRLREHRVLPDHVRATLLQAAALPPSPAARRRIVGYSEPMLWQSASEPDSVLPTLSLANGIGNGTSGSHNAAAASLPPDLRDLAHSAPQSDGTHHASQRVIPTVSVEQAGFRSIELPADSIQLTVPSGPVLSPPDKDSANRAPFDTLSALDSKTPSSRTAKRPIDASHKSEASKVKASHEVSRQSFAIIEPLASALQLPIATTASLLGGAGLALLGLGLLLVRAAIRWRHS